jgi:prevent-host-death family protein
MNAITASQARSNLFRLIDTTAEHHEPVLITGKRNNAVLIGEQDWKSIQETIYLLSVPGMKESIIEGMNAPASELLTEAEFYAQLEADEPAQPNGDTAQ